MVVVNYICPNCRAKLESKQDSFFCPTCSIEFKNKDGIFVFLPTNADGSVVEDIQTWENTNSDREGRLSNIEALLTNEYRMREFIDNIDWDKLRTGKALEIGGGICWGSAIAKSKSPLLEVVATDIAVSSLIKAREISKVFNVQIDKFIALNIQSSPFPDDSFDFIFGFAVLHHLPDLKRQYLRYTVF